MQLALIMSKNSKIFLYNFTSEIEKIEKKKLLQTLASIHSFKIP